MARKGENIYKRKDGRWEGRQVVGKKEDGKTRFRCVYGGSYREVKERLTLLKAAAYRGKTPPPVNVKLENFLNDWLYGRIKLQVKPSTFNGYVRLAERYLLPSLGPIDIAKIQEEHIRRLEDDLAGKLKPSSARNVLRLLMACMKAATYAGLIAQSPFAYYKMRKASREKPRVLTAREQRQLEQAAMSEGRLEYMVPLYMGLRVGEICALRWQDVNLTARTLRVMGTVQRLRAPGGHTRLHIGSPKSDCSRREIPIPVCLIPSFQALRRQSAPMPQGFVFPGAGGGMLDPRTLQYRFSALMKRLGIQGAHMHTLRHTFAMRCLERRVGFEVLAHLMGHSSPRVTMDYYANTTDEAMRRSVNLLKPIARWL